MTYVSRDPLRVASSLECEPSATDYESHRNGQFPNDMPPQTQWTGRSSSPTNTEKPNLDVSNPRTSRTNYNSAANIARLHYSCHYNKHCYNLIRKPMRQWQFRNACKFLSQLFSRSPSCTLRSHNSPNHVISCSCAACKVTIARCGSPWVNHPNSINNGRFWKLKISLWPSSPFSRVEKLEFLRKWAIIC